MRGFLGLDSSTQSLTAIVIDTDAQKVMAEHSVAFDERLPHYGTKNGTLVSDDPRVVHSPPLMWCEALDLCLAELRSKTDLSGILAISCSGQQHGSVYLNSKAEPALSSLTPARGLAQQLRDIFSRKTSPIWMDSSTSRQCGEISDALGGSIRTAELTGSVCFERFTGPQIRKFCQEEPLAYEKTAGIQLVSSFLATLLTGRIAPVDTGDGAGMNLMDIRTRMWSKDAVSATAPGLSGKLPGIVSPDTVLGRIAPYFAEKYGFSPGTAIVASSGDNPNSLIGVGRVKPGEVTISLGTSDTYFGIMSELRTDPAGEGHVFGAPTGDYMSLICFKNGSLAREKVRGMYGLDWKGFSGVLRNTEPGNGGRIMLPYFDPEIVPAVLTPGVHRFGFTADDMKANVRGVIEAQMLSMKIHSAWMNVRTSTIFATGGASKNRDILQVMADVHQADVYGLEVSKSAALGAALRAAHAFMKSKKEEPSWGDLVAAFCKPDEKYHVKPDKSLAGFYRSMAQTYRACEKHALYGGPPPEMPAD